MSNEHRPEWTYLAIKVSIMTLESVKAEIKVFKAEVLKEEIAAALKQAACLLCHNV